MKPDEGTKDERPVSLDLSNRRWARNAFDCAGRHPYTAAQDSNIARKKVNRERHSSLVRPHSAFARVLSLLLLGFVVYGTTVEAAHTHGNLTAATSAVGASNFSDPAAETKANTSVLGCGDCLICQLHQQFSTTLISVPPSLSQSSLKAQFFKLTTVSVLSQTSAPRTGRAPPQNS
jgi:hypothetical protein